MKNFLYILFFLASFSFVYGQKEIDLSGDWQFEIDREDEGVKQSWFSRKLNDNIKLPGSMQEHLKGDLPNVNTQWTASLYDSSFFFNPAMERYRLEENFKVLFFLTPLRHYVGVAWYQKSIDIPKDWKNERIILHLERPHIETTLWVNNQEVGMQNSLSVPHIYDITEYAKIGTNTISLRVDNRIKEINVGIDSHSITDHTQGNWNGIVGEIKLTTTPKTYWEDIQIYPDLKNKSAIVEMEVASNSKSASKVEIMLNVESFNSEQKHVLTPTSEKFKIKDGVLYCAVEIEFGEEMQTWDEFDPALYRLTAQLISKKGRDIKEVEFGMRDFTIQGKWFYVNDIKTHLRGTNDCAAYPLTGYPPTDLESWINIFSTMKKNGLNHVRYHSWSPPEAAFKAADRLGFYLQPEGPSWPNHGPRLGVGEPIDKYLMEETQKMVKHLGNYASFCMLAAGNEPAGNWVAWVTDFVDYWEKTDPRRVYTGASVGNSWRWQPRNQYHVKAGARGLNWDKKQPESISDYRTRIDTISQPYVSHENGQWCVFPNFKEIEKHTGVNRAGNYEIFRDILSNNGMAHKAHDFMMASGKLQALCYKYETEQHLRTPDYAGYQMLGLTDFPGQGSAIIGLLDVFFDEKEYVSAEEIKRYNNHTVLLARIPKFTFNNSETFEAEIEVAHFHKEVFKNAKTIYEIKDINGNIVNKGVISQQDIPIGNYFNLGKISFKLNEIEIASKLNLEVKIEGTDIINDWNFWVYPTKVEIDSKDLYISNSFDNKAIKVLEKGGNVLITASGQITYGAGIVQKLTPVFWNTSWFQMRPPHTTGILVNEKHPLFNNFPTEYHSNLQWWELLNNSQVMLLSNFDNGFEPLVQNIDTWFLSRKIGSLIEANVLNGKLMVTTMDISTNLENRIVARQMRKAIIDYMNSNEFEPRQSATLKQIEELFTKATPPVNMFTDDSPQDLMVDEIKK